MKQYIALFAALVMLLSCAVSTNAQEAIPLAVPEESRAQTLIVGHTTMMNGNFFSELWGNNTADIDVRSLLHEYPLISWTSNGDYQLNNTVVRALETVTRGNGNKVYTVTLQDDLLYSDGSPITAKDYVFSFLLMSSPRLRELSGLVSARDYIAGFDDYQTETTPEFSGIRLLGEQTFSVEITAESLPYYFELNYINTSPLPYKVLASGSDIADDGKGAYITDDFTAQVLRNTLLNNQTGYLSHPKVTSGPYRLVRYDDSAHTAEFEINPFYKGNYEGQVPLIPKLLFREIKNENIIDELNNGTVDLVNKVTEGQVIDEGIALSADGNFAAVPYLRSGAGFLAIAGERELTSSLLVRQAIAYALDYDVLPRDFLKGYGERVYGYYGLGQWMVPERQAQLEEMNPYILDLTKAEALFAQDGWTLNEAGEPFDANTDVQRYKRIDNDLKPLTLVLAVTEKNMAADLVADMLGQNLENIGGKLAILSLPLNQALRQYYRQDERQFDLLFQGTNFTYLFNPSNTYLVGDQYQGTMNTSGIQDRRLEELAVNMTKQQPGNRDAYLNNWMEFQKYWTEILPMIPLYSNTYHDLFVSDLQGYFPQFYWNWGTAVLYSALNR